MSSGQISSSEKHVNRVHTSLQASTVFLWVYLRPSAYHSFSSAPSPFTLSLYPTSYTCTILLPSTILSIFYCLISLLQTRYNWILYRSWFCSIKRSADAWLLLCFGWALDLTAFCHIENTRSFKLNTFCISDPSSSHHLS